MAVAVLLQAVPQVGLAQGDRIEIVGWAVSGSTVVAIYVLPDGTVPLLPLPADAVRLEREESQ